MSAEKATQLLLAQPVKAKGAKASSQAPTPAEASFAIAYLSEFGYFKTAIDLFKDVTLEDIVSAIKLFQRWFVLPSNGLLTSQTVRAMEWPRCGQPDVVRDRHVEAIRLKDFVKDNMPRWRKDNLTYHVDTYVPGVKHAEADEVFARAFASWVQHGGIKVNKASRAKDADIVISTGEGPRSNFDGPGGTLAWAYLPDGSDRQLLMRFDLGETWVTTPGQRGILLGNVAAHEFGHLFGLGHSRIHTSLMAPIYNPHIGEPQVEDDVARFKTLYATQ